MTKRAVTLREFASSIREAASFHQATILAVLARFAKLYILRRYSREEIFYWGLADPHLKADDLADYVSREELHDMQLTYNPAAYNYITEDKIIFYLFCKGAGIRTPELYAVFDPLLSWAADGQRLSNRDDWAHFFADKAPDAFVIKPSLGVHGKAIGVFHRTADGFVDFSSKRYSPEDLYGVMAGNSEFHRFVIQECLTNHPKLARLSGSAAVQCVRTVTLTRNGQRPEILFAVQKIIRGDSVADNFLWGRTGNMVANVDPQDGTIDKVVTGIQDGFGTHEIEAHPTTGERITGFKLPYWAELRTLVEDAAWKMLPIRTVGWDVALTPEGPVIIEGNMWWHPDHHNALRQMRRFVGIHSDAATHAPSCAA